MRRSKGFTLLETLIALAVVAIVAVGLVAGLGAAFKMLSITNDRNHAKTLAEYQMEYVQASSYQASYIPAANPSGYGSDYSVSIGVTTPSGGDANIQQIIVTVKYPFSPSVGLTLTGYKVNNNQ